MVRDVRRQQQRVATADDALLAQVGRVPVDFVLQLVGLDDLGRRAEALRQAARGRSRSRARWPGSPRDRCRRAAGRGARGAVDERRAARIVPRLRVDAHAARRTHHDNGHTRSGGAPRGARNRCMIGEYRRGVHGSNRRAMSLDEFRARARARATTARASRPRLARRPARHRHAGRGVRQAAPRAVRLPARVGAGRRRDVGALHVHGHRAARRVEAARRRRPGLDARARLAQRPPPGRSARRPRGAPPRRASRSRCRRSASSGAARSATSATTSRASSSGCRRRRRAASTCPTRCSSSPTRWSSSTTCARRRAWSRRRALDAERERRRRSTRRTTRALRTVDATIARLRGAVVARRRSTSIRRRRPPRARRVYAQDEFLARRRAHRAVHRRRRRLPGAARAPHRRAARLLVDAISIARCA